MKKKEFSTFQKQQQGNMNDHEAQYKDNIKALEDAL